LSATIVADARTRGQIIAIFLGRSGRDFDRDDPEHILGGAVGSVLDERRLHDTDQRFAVGRKRQPFHALVGDAAGGVAADFGCTVWR